MAMCTKCGVELKQGASFCTACGCQAQAGPQQQGQPGQTTMTYNPAEQKSKLVAGLLGILLGGWGVHNFYLGRIGIGVLQIVVTIFTFGLGAWWGIIEGILILVGHDSFKTCARGIPLKD